MVTLYKASRTESRNTIWHNFKKLIVGESMSSGSHIKYNIEYACIIDNKYLLLRGWSYAKDSYTKTLISNCGFFLDKVPSMLSRKQLFEANKLLSHENVGFMFYGPVEHVYDTYLNIELVSDEDVVELDIKLKHFDSLKQLVESTPEKDMSWLAEILIDQK